MPSTLGLQYRCERELEKAISRCNDISGEHDGTILSRPSRSILPLFLRHPLRLLTHCQICDYDIDGKLVKELSSIQLEFKEQLPLPIPVTSCMELLTVVQRGTVVLTCDVYL